MTHGLRNSLSQLKGVSFIKKWSGVISERRLVYLQECVCQKIGSTRETVTWIYLYGHAQTHTHTTLLFYPWYVISLLFNRRHSYRTGQDIENCGTCRDCACIIYRYMAACIRVCVNLFLHIYSLFYMLALRAQCVSWCTVMCIMLSFWITSVLGNSVLWLGRIVVLFCVTAQPDTVLWVWPVVAQTPLQVWSLNTVMRDLLRPITHTLSCSPSQI